MFPNIDLTSDEALDEEVTEVKATDLLESMGIHVVHL